MNFNRILAIVLPLLLIITYKIAFTANKPSADSYLNYKVTFTEKKHWFSSLEYCSIGVIKPGIFLAVCDNPKKDSQRDYGRRIYLVKFESDSPKILFESRGGFDSYGIVLNVFKSSKIQDKFLILGDTGTESYTATLVFSLEGLKFTEIGYIDAVVLNQNSEQRSVIPYIVITGDGDDIEFSFLRNVALPINSAYGNPIVVSKNNIIYRYTSGIFQRKLTKKVSDLISKKLAYDGYGNWNKRTK